MLRSWIALPLLLCSAFLAERGLAMEAIDFKAPPHDYWEKPLRDPITSFLAKTQKGEIRPDTSSNLPFLVSVLKALKVPVSSQLLVYSATSLQSGLIHPSNPRALYFNEDTYIGFVPGGRVELIGIDPDLGAIFYIFNPLSQGAMPQAERSNRCMNCHAGPETNRLPGLIAESVVVSNTGASLDTYRHDVTGHQIPLDQRFGGWHLTGGHHLAEHHGNILGQLSPQGLTTQVIMPGEMSDLRRYPLPTSDILPHLVYEHQIGFVNRVMTAAYTSRTLNQQNKGRPTPEDEALINEQARELTRYLLFSGEATLPPQGIEGDSGFMRDFLQLRKAASNGLSLRDFDLKTRMFKNRCSYMIYTAQFAALPATIKERVFAGLWAALKDQGSPPEFAYLRAAEKGNIRQILKETLPGVPTWWR